MRATSCARASTGLPRSIRIGCAPARAEQGSYVSYGHSIAVDPWGTVLCRADEKETILYADLDLSRVKAVRQQLPILSARRTDLYEIREK